MKQLKNPDSHLSVSPLSTYNTCQYLLFNIILQSVRLVPLSAVPGLEYVWISCSTNQQSICQEISDIFSNQLTWEWPFPMIIIFVAS